MRICFEKLDQVVKIKSCRPDSFPDRPRTLSLCPQAAVELSGSRPWGLVQIAVSIVPLVCASATTAATSSAGSIRRRVSGAAPSDPSKPPSARRNTLTARAEAATSDPCVELSAGMLATGRTQGTSRPPVPSGPRCASSGPKTVLGRPDRPHADAQQSSPRNACATNIQGRFASPTRAALLTCRNHTCVGSGTIAEGSVAFDGYAGIMPKTVATGAEVLKHEVISWLPMACLITL
jgi:hypothetical protein